MELKIVEKKEQPLLERTEIIGEISFTGKATPKEEEVKKELNKAVKVSEDLLVIKKIDTKFGQTHGKVMAYSYKTKEAKDQIEPKIKEKKKKEAKKEKEEGKE